MLGPRVTTRTPAPCGHLDEGDVGVLLGGLAPRRLERLEGDGGVIAVREQRVAARGAEVHALGVAVPAVVTEHADHGTPPPALVLLVAIGARPAPQSAVRSA